MSLESSRKVTCAPVGRAIQHGGATVWVSIKLRRTPRWQTLPDFRQFWHRCSASSHFKWRSRHVRQPVRTLRGLPTFCFFGLPAMRGEPAEPFELRAMALPRATAWRDSALVFEAALPGDSMRCTWCESTQDPGTGRSTEAFEPEGEKPCASGPEAILALASSGAFLEPGLQSREPPWTSSSMHMHIGPMALDPQQRLYETDKYISNYGNRCILLKLTRRATGKKDSQQSRDTKPFSDAAYKACSATHAAPRIASTRDIWQSVLIIRLEILSVIYGWGLWTTMEFPTLLGLKTAGGIYQ
jgi:hypothetical protein